jgi:hypothetical protein
MNGEKLRALLYNLWASSEMDTPCERDLHEARLAADALIAENARLAADLDDSVRHLVQAGVCQSQLATTRDFERVRAELAESVAMGLRLKLEASEHALVKRTKERDKARSWIMAYGVEPDYSRIGNTRARAIADEPEEN